MQKASAEMPGNLVHREHMLSRLGMQSFLYASGVKTLPTSMRQVILSF